MGNHNLYTANVSSYGGVTVVSNEHLLHQSSSRFYKRHHNPSSNDNLEDEAAMH